MPNGVRLNAAGELFIQRVRQQLSDIERVKSQIADLSGVRRGHVTVLCGQASMVSFLPQMVTRYRVLHPGVSFSIFVSGRRQAAERLIDYSADLSLVFEPEASTGVRVLFEIPQRMYTLVSEKHPLIDEKELRLSQCVQYPLAMPSQRAGHGPGEGIKAIPINVQDLPPGVLQLSQQRGRNLPVAAAQFAAFVTDDLHAAVDQLH